ncbi:MAG: methionyl-tRNA formyltransferase [Saccharofermentanales bacterium]|nr:methionyl-tRNA formyltransferase [Clostridiaceae bacterium]
MRPRVLFMGTPDFAVPALQRLLDEAFPIVGVVSQPDRPRGRNLHLTVPPVGRLAEARGLPLLQPENIRSKAFADQIRVLSPDLIVTAAYGRILPADILAIPKLGSLNIHASLLPAYRGAAPIQWCLINGDTETGVTIMLMDEGMDTGDILARQRVDIPEEMYADQLSRLLAQLGADLLPQTIDDFVSGRLEPQPQDHTLATTARMLKRETGRIVWDESARTIYNLIRGTYPWPGAFTYCGKKRIKIHKARVCTDPDIISAAAGLEPGTVCDCQGDAISVACGEGVIDLLEIQTDSGKKMQCRDCSHNYRLGQMMEG